MAVGLDSTLDHCNNCAQLLNLFQKKRTKRQIFRAGLRHIMDKERTNGDTCCKIEDGIRLNLNRGIRDLGCHVLNQITKFNQKFLLFCRDGIMASSFCKRGVPIKEGLLRISVYSNFCHCLPFQKRVINTLNISMGFSLSGINYTKGTATNLNPNPFPQIMMILNLGCDITVMTTTKILQHC